MAERRRARARWSMPSLGRLAPRLRPLVAKPPGSRGEGTSAWILAAMHGSLYVALSASLVLANKHLVVNTRTPILIASLGSLFGTIVAWTLVGCGRVELKTRLTTSQWVTYVLPTGVFAAVALAFANLALTFVSLSLAQMAKAFAPAVTAAALVTLRLDRAFDDKCARAVCVIVGGCVVAAWGATATGNEPHAWIGLGCMVACEIAEALRLCGVQYLLSSSSTVKNNATTGNSNTNTGFDPATSNPGSSQPTNQGMTLFDGLFYFSPISLASLWLLVYAFEWDGLSAELHGRAALGNPLSLLATGTFGFLANVAGLGVVQHGGAVTLTTLSLLKNGVVIALAVVAYGDPVTVRAVAGYTAATYGFVMYQEARAKAAAAAAAQGHGGSGIIGGGGGGIVEGGVGLVGGNTVTLGVGVAPTGVGVDLGVGAGAMNGVVVGGGDGSMSASSSAKSLQRTSSGHVVTAVLGLPKLKTGRPGGGAKATGSSKGGGGGDTSPRRRAVGNVDKEREPLIP